MAEAKMPLGVIIGLSGDISGKLREVEQLGIPTCQATGSAEGMLNEGTLDALADGLAKTSVAISAVFVEHSGYTYNLDTGPATDGLVPQQHRQRRTELTLKAVDLVKQLGITTVCAHVGFIPDDEQDPLYAGFLDSMKLIAKHLESNGQVFLFETGQELPSTLKRTIDHIGTDNVFVNLDPANLILYGKANPLDAVAILGPWVRGMHAKDGLWPNRDESLGTEVRLGEGSVNFPLLLRRLKACGFQGPVTIEREVSGPEQIADIRHAMDFLEPML